MKVWWSVCNEVGCRQQTTEATLRAGLDFRRLLLGVDSTLAMTGAWKNWYLRHVMRYDIGYMNN